MSGALSAATAVKSFDRARLPRLADTLLVAVAVSLPWSTSATAVLLFLWLVAVLPSVRFADLRQTLAHPAGGLPIVLWLTIMVGILWCDASLAERFYAARGFHKLLVIPLLMVQARRSANAHWVLGGFLVSCTVLLGVSWLMHLSPTLSISSHLSVPGVPVKDYIIQSTEFLLCAFGLAHLAINAWQTKRRGVCVALAALALLFLANVAFVATGRTALAALPILLALLAVQRFGWKGTAVVAVAGILLAGLAWASSSYLRERTLGVIEEIHQYQAQNVETSSGFRLEFWRKSIEFVASAPLIGHGTGSIEPLFRQARVGESGIAAAVTANPHNETLEIAVQLGLLGVSVLYAMWIAQIMLFRGRSIPSWLGLGAVAQTIVGSLFLAYIAGFSSGWIATLAIGVLGGMALADREKAAERGPPKRARSPQAQLS